MVRMNTWMGKITEVVLKSPDPVENGEFVQIGDFVERFVIFSDNLKFTLIKLGRREISDNFSLIGPW